MNLNLSILIEHLIYQSNKNTHRGTKGKKKTIYAFPYIKKPFLSTHFPPVRPPCSYESYTIPSRIDRPESKGWSS